MDAEPEPSNQWPDFIPPDLEASIASAPTEPAATDRVAQSPPVPLAPARGHRPPRRRPPDPERWFRSPPAGNRAGIRRPQFRVRSPIRVTMSLVVVCVLVWIGQLLSWQVTELFELVPSLGAQQPWRFITSMIAHSPRQITHIGFNLLTLWLLGKHLESLLGWRKYLELCLLSGLGGSVVFVLLAFPPDRSLGTDGINWTTGVLGSSGIIFGLFGAHAVLAWLGRRPLTSIWVLLGLNVALTLLFPGIAWQVHLGGLLTGAAAAWILLVPRRSGRRQHPFVTRYGLVVLGCLLVVLLVIKYLVTG